MSQSPLLKPMPTHLHAGAQTPRKSGQCLDRRILEPVSARTRDWAEGEGEPGFLGVDAPLGSCILESEFTPSDPSHP